MLVPLAKGLRICVVENLGPRAEPPPGRPEAGLLPHMMLMFKNWAESSVEDSRKRVCKILHSGGTLFIPRKLGKLPQVLPLW